MKYLSVLIVIAALWLALSGCSVTISPGSPLGTATVSTAEPHWGVQT